MILPFAITSKGKPHHRHAVFSPAPAWCGHRHPRHEGIWGRWKDYFATGHGGNVGLKETFGKHDEQRLQNITFAILEVLDPNAEDGEINRRETHWKHILLSREFGHNRN